MELESQQRNELGINSQTSVIVIIQLDNLGVLISLIVRIVPSNMMSW